MTVQPPADPSSSAPPAPPSAASRAFAAAGLALWAFLFGVIWAHAPAPVKILAPAWAALGVIAPNAFLASLGLAFPFFGNNPGGEHHLYLLDLGLMGFVARDLALRLAGRRAARPDPLNIPARFFVLVSALAILPQRMHIECEVRLHGFEGIYNFYRYYANAPYYGARAWLNLALAASMFAAIRDSPPSPLWRRRIWHALLAGAVLAAIVGLLEYPGWLSLRWWRGENPRIARFGYKRLQSLFWHSGWLSQYLGAIAPAALALAVAARSRLGRWGWLAVVALLGLAQLLTMQRGGWLNFAAGFATVALFFTHSLRPAVRTRFLRSLLVIGSLGVVVVAAGAAVNAPLRHRLGEMLKYSDRSLIWGSAVRLWREDPLTGIGIGNYTPMHLRLIPPGDPLFGADDKTTGHNTCLQLGAERGVLAVGLFLWLFCGAAIRLGRAALRPEPDEAPSDQSLSKKTEALALLGALVALGVDGVFQYIFYIRLTEIFFWLGLGFAVAAAPPLPAARPALLGARGWCAIAALIVALFLWVDRYAFGPWQMGTDRGVFYMGGGEVKLPIPRGAKRIVVPVYAFDPQLPAQPFTYAFWLEGKLLGTKTFESVSGADVELELPANRNPESPLVIRTSRTANAYPISEGRIPLAEMGVLYQPPRAL